MNCLYLCNEPEEIWDRLLKIGEPGLRDIQQSLQHRRALTRNLMRVLLRIDRANGHKKSAVDSLNPVARLHDFFRFFPGIHKQITKYIASYVVSSNTQYMEGVCTKLLTFTKHVRNDMDINKSVLLKLKQSGTEGTIFDLTMHSGCFRVYSTPKEPNEVYSYTEEWRKETPYMSVGPHLNTSGWNVMYIRNKQWETGLPIDQKRELLDILDYVYIVDE